MTDTLDKVLDGGLILVVLVGIGLLILILKRQRMIREMQALTADMSLAETVARIGYWKRGFNPSTPTWSAGMYEIFGQDPKYFSPTVENVGALFLPQDLPAVRALTEPETTHRKGGEIESRIRMPDGTIKDVLVAIRFRISKGGKVTGLFGLVADITARKSAERAIAEREEQLQLAVSAMGAAIWDWDIGTDRLFAGPRFAEILGLDPLTFNPTMALHHQLCHPEDLVKVQDAFRENIRTGTPYAVEYRMRHSAGHYIWVHSRGRVVTYDGDRPVRAIGTVVDVTERHKAEEELRSSRESLSLAMQASQAGHMDILRPGEEAYWSPRAMEILGLPPLPTGITADAFAQLIHPDDLPEFLANREELRAHGTPLDTQVRIKHSAGHYLWLHIREINMKLDGGRTRTIGIFRDVSTVVQAQRQLADSERKFRNLIEGSLQGSLILCERKPMFCNQALARIFGYDHAEEILALENLGDHLPAERLDEVQVAWQRALRGELDGKIRRAKIIDRAGRTRWIEIIERLIQWEGAPARQMAILDVTEQETIQVKLRASEERFRLLADNVSDVITLFDQDQVLRYVSPSIERIAGYKPEELIGQPIYALLMPEDIPSPEVQIRLAKEPHVGAYVWRMRTKEGRPLWMESTSSLVPPLAGQNGYNVVSAVRNVNERVEREAELSAARDRLKDQADELTILAQNLEMERERAEQANAAKSHFLAMMSHELRTPMTGVLGMSDLLLMSKLNAEQEELTRLLKRSARALLDLLNDILDFSKIEAGQLEFESTAFNLSEVLSDVVYLFAPIASNKGVTLDSQLPPSYWNVVKGDPKRLRQVLSNLVGNAIKFTERGRVTISFEQTPASGDAIRLQFKVTDTGIGVSEEDESKLFKPFVQADISTSRKYGGTGLGLAISKRLVEGMGGEIRMASILGEGSTFSFNVQVLPDRTIPEVISDGALHRISVEHKDEAVAATSRTILLAEDNETSRYLIVTMLTRMGHTVDAVTNGVEAVEAVRGKTYDVVLMDMQMPVMDGADATREIRKFTSHKARIPIIALTADVIASHRSTYLAAGVNAIVGKPVDWAELAEEIERQLAARPAADPEKARKSAAKLEAAAPRTGGMLALLDKAPVLDEAALTALADALSEDILAPMLNTFSENMAKYQEELGIAVAAGDLKQAKRIAHALKGLCAQFGAVRASVLGKFVEMDAGNVAAVSPLLPVLNDIVAATETALAARRARVAAHVAQKAG